MYKKGNRAKSRDCPPVAAPDNNDIEMDRESVKKVSVDSFNKPILSPVKKTLCQYSGPLYAGLAHLNSVAYARSLN
jgi:hypothetical protein